MGCSASCPANFVTQHRDPSAKCSSCSHCNPQLLSPSSSFSDPFVNPVPRTLSVAAPLIYHPPVRKGDSNHLVSLTSTTYGSLLLPNPSFKNDRTVQTKGPNDLGGSEDPLSPVSVINTWELMKGLDEDEFSFNMVESPKKPCKREIDCSEFVEQPMSRPLWKYLSEESLLAKMESNVASSYRKALLGRQQGCQKYKCNIPKPKNVEFSECEKNSPLVFQDRKDSCPLLVSDDRIVLYYTSLRGIRKTYEDCCMVRVILRGYRVRVDEKDISMDRSYRNELQDALGGKGVSLPQVFVKGKNIGSVEEIKQLNESGELAKILEGFSVMDLGFVCKICGDVRFVPCPNCYGSRKVFDEEEGKLIWCPECNENGLIRCSLCCS